MDDKDDDKKRVLTPPSEWADGMKPKSPSETEEIDESTDWLEDDDFEVPPAAERSSDGEPSADEEPSAGGEPSADSSANKEASLDNDVSASEAPKPDESVRSDADAILTDHGEAQAEKSGGSKLPWAVAIAGFVVAGGMSGLWLDAQETAKTEIAELKNTIRSMKRAENQQSNQDSDLVADNEALQQQIAALQQQNNQLAEENEALKNREAERAQAAISASTKTGSEMRTPAGGSAKPDASSSSQIDAKTTNVPPSQTGGVWFVNLESHKSRAVAEERLSSLRAKIRSTNLSIANANVNGQTYYRVRAAGYASKTDATAASKWMAQTLKAGPFWVGKDRDNVSQSPTKTAAPVKTQVAKQASTPPSRLPVRQAKTKKPIQLRSLPMRDNWFVFVDTYDSGQRADEVISTLNNQGLDAKVAVESRSGELFYRVQIVGIESEATGNTIVAQLRADEFKNARLRKTVN